MYYVPICATAIINAIGMQLIITLKVLSFLCILLTLSMLCEQD